jgi:hypothetical protein
MQVKAGMHKGFWKKGSNSHLVIKKIEDNLWGFMHWRLNKMHTREFTYA